MTLTTAPCAIRHSLCILTALQIGSAFLLGLFWQQVGWLAHDFLHHQVFRHRWANNWAGLCLGNVFQVCHALLDMLTEATLWLPILARRGSAAIDTAERLSVEISIIAPRDGALTPLVELSTDPPLIRCVTLCLSVTAGFQRRLVEVEAQHASCGAERAGG